MKIKINLIKVLSVAFVCAFFASISGAKELTVQEKLEKGQSLYEAGDYDKAMDNFLDVFVGGNVEQINIANEYVNMIHFKRGGVSTPVRVEYDEELEAQKQAYKQEALDLQEEISQEYEDAKNNVKERAASVQEEVQTAIEEQRQELRDLQQQQQDRLAEAQEEIDAEISEMQSDIAVLPQRTQAVLEDQEEEYFEEDFDDESQETIVQEDAEEELTEREEKIAQDIKAMQDSLIAKLNAVEGVNVYLRQNKVDAIDIDSKAIFLDDKIAFSQQGKEILEDVYALMLSAKEPIFVLLPPGSYTDEVELQGVRQAVALNSYLINMGISSAKLNFNMGLVNEQPPAKFSNLEGLSIVFDYDNEPVLYNKVSDSNAYPVLSLGMYPEKINTSLGEGMIIDFSVVETSAPIESWKLQIIQHASDGKYYVVRQLSGSDAVYEQIFWNGKKQYFGAALPDGKYTLILTAKDKEGREKIVRRKVEIVSENKKEEPVKEVEEAKQAKVSKQSSLSYSNPRLWTKPAKILKNKKALTETVNTYEEYSFEDYEGKKENVEVTTTTVQTQTTTTSSTKTTQNEVVNPSATPSEQTGEDYDPYLEELL